MEKPSLSIVIINFNTKGLVVDCVNSVIASDTKTTYEIIIVDNGSTDGSRQAISQLKTIHQRSTAQIKTIFNDSNLGFAKANNQAIKIALGESILLLNSDTVVERGSIDRLYDFAQGTEDAGVVGARLLNSDESIQGSVIYLPTLRRAIEQYWLGKKQWSEMFTPDTEKPTEVEAVAGAAFLITPQALKKAGLLDERYFFYFEDLDYCRKVAQAGLKVYYHPQSGIVHLHGASGKQMASANLQWKRLVPSSKIYHGRIKHLLINFVIWSGQKCKRILRK